MLARDERSEVSKRINWYAWAINIIFVLALLMMVFPEIRSDAISQSEARQTFLIALMSRFTVLALQHTIKEGVQP